MSPFCFITFLCLRCSWVNKSCTTCKNVYFSSFLVRFGYLLECSSVHVKHIYFFQSGALIDVKLEKCDDK